MSSVGAQCSMGFELKRSIASLPQLRSVSSACLLLEWNRIGYLVAVS